MSDVAKCEICGEPMPPGEEVFKFHGYSGPCPKPPLPRRLPRKFVTPRTCPLGEDGKFQSTVAEFVHEEAEVFAREHGIVGVTREFTRHIIQAFEFADDESKRQYEAYCNRKERR